MIFEQIQYPFFISHLWAGGRFFRPLVVNEVVFKLSIVKAYDRVSWGFLDRAKRGKVSGGSGSGCKCLGLHIVKNFPFIATLKNQIYMKHIIPYKNFSTENNSQRSKVSLDVYNKHNIIACMYAHLYTYILKCR